MSDTNPKLSKISHFSPIWIVPIIALLIAFWLAFSAWKQKGPEIEIIFDDAAGITVGRTPVRFRDVEVGKVVNTRLSEDFEKVSIFVELDRQVSPLLSENTRFWVVEPRITLGGVSGLDTLLSGVYIEMDPGDKGKDKFQFEGLTEPPSVRSYESGTQYLLIAESLGSLDIGAAIYHRQVPVGEVTSYRLDGDKGRVEIRIFIEAPYDALIKTNTNFWNVSGFGFELGSAGVVAHVESLASVLGGGLSFETPPDIDGLHNIAEDGREFHLFRDKAAVAEGALTYSYPYLLQFNSSVRGLVAGAPVEFRGIQVGRVDHVGLESGISAEREIDVIISIQPERIDPNELPTIADLNTLFAELASEGMRAQMKTQSYLTGSLYIDLVPDAADQAKPPITSLAQRGQYLLIPSADSEYSKIARSVADIANQIAELPFKQIGDRLQGSLDGVATLLGDVNEAKIVDDMDELLEGMNGSVSSLESAIDGMRDTLLSIDQAVAPDSELQHELSEMLDDVSDAAKSVEALTDELSRYPGSLIRGKDESR